MMNPDKEGTSIITEHIAKSNHACDRKGCFKIIHKARIGRVLKLIEAVAIRQLKPKLNVQKMFDYSLKLPWH